MIRVILASHEPEKMIDIGQEIIENPKMKVVSFAQSIDVLLSKISTEKPDIIVLSEFPEIPTVDILAKIPNIAVFVIVDHASESYINTLKEAGMKKAFLWEESSHIIETILELFAASEKPAPDEQEEAPSYSLTQTTVFVCSSKGGVGKTTLATNFAVAAKMKLKNQRIVLIDFDPFGCNIAFNNHLRDSDVAGCNITMFHNNIEDILLDGPKGIKIIASPINFEIAKEVTPGLADRLLTALKKAFSVVVIDGAPNYSVLTETAMLHATHVLGVCNPEGTSIKQIARLIDRTESHKKIFPVLNYIQPISRNDFNPAEIPKLLEKPLLATIPFDENVKKTLHSNKQQVAVEANSNFSSVLMKMVDQICGTPDIEPKRGFWQKLKRR